MPMSYILDRDQRTSGHVGLIFYGYGGSSSYRTVVQPLDGINIPSIESDSSRWPTRMCLGLLTLPMFSERAMSFRRSWMADSTQTGLRCLAVQVTQMIGYTITSTGESESDSPKSLAFTKYVASFADRDMVMRYHFGLGIGHAYSHTQPPCPSGCITESHNDLDDLERLTDSLESEHADFESVTSSPGGSDLESDEECGELNSESVLGDYADLDGWDDTDMVALNLNEYEF